MKKFWLVMFVTVLTVAPGYCQDTQQLLGQVAQVYAGEDVPKDSLIGGFSLWGLMGGMLFGGIGFIAFIYGKKNAEFRPMMIGILLMAYPYFVRGTFALYLVGAAFTGVLYFFRE